MGFIHFYYITYKRFLELLYCQKLLIFQCSLHINYVRKLIHIFILLEIDDLSFDNTYNEERDVCSKFCVLD